MDCPPILDLNAAQASPCRAEHGNEQDEGPGRRIPPSAVFNVGSAVFNVAPAAYIEFQPTEFARPFDRSNALRRNHL